MDIKRKCPYCVTTFTIKVDGDDYQSWLNGAKIQDAFKYLSKGQRESIQTGYHDKCFDKAFPDD